MKGGVQMKRGYIRVSTIQQRIDRQEERLKEEVDILYVDKASGSSRKGRQELEQMLTDLNPGDEVIILSIDRLARSTLDLLNIVEEIKKKGASLRSLHESWLDTREDNPSGEFMLTIMGGLAEMERKQINKRVMEGIEIAKKKGVKFGRPVANQDRVNHALDLYDSGRYTVKEVERLTGISKSTIYRRLKERGD